MRCIERLPVFVQRVSVCGFYLSSACSRFGSFGCLYLLFFRGICRAFCFDACPRLFFNGFDQLKDDAAVRFRSGFLHSLFDFRESLLRHGFTCLLRVSLSSLKRVLSRLSCLCQNAQHHLAPRPLSFARLCCLKTETAQPGFRPCFASYRLLPNLTTEANLQRKS